MGSPPPIACTYGKQNLLELSAQKPMTNIFGGTWCYGIFYSLVRIIKRNSQSNNKRLKFMSLRNLTPLTEKQMQIEVKDPLFGMSFMFNFLSA